jgi:hypothetical protein
VLTRFELYNEKNERVCICKFIENYSKLASINGYFSRPVFRNYHNEIFGTMKYLGRSWVKLCKNTSTGIMDEDVVMIDDDNDQNRGKDDDIDIEEWWQHERKKIRDDGDNVSFGKTEQNRAQNNTPNDTNDTLHTLHGPYSDYPPICYYCDYKADSKDDYEAHVIMRHGHSPAYPNKAEIEKMGLKAQEKSWEI